MNRVICIISLLAALFATRMEANAQKQVEKTNPMKIYMHYMPWFETPESIGIWGWHWTMNTMNPDKIIDSQRQIASHYYPLIGPYASRDKDVIEYHLLLMKLSGVDGILIDWYGTVGSNGDVKDLLKSSDSIVSYTDDFGIDFGVVLEDRFSRSANDVKANLAYLRYNYFNRQEYIRIGIDSLPLLCIFGPITFQEPADWTDILPSAGEEVNFVTLWYESDEAGSNASGEFSWIYQDELNHLGHLDNFYENRADQLDIAIGSAYPGFNDYYSEGGVGEGYFNIPHYYGSTLTETLNRAEENSSKIDMLQLATFNDFGEGTIFEPTRETGFDYLSILQDFTGVNYTVADLELVHKLYLHRKGYKHDSIVQDSLDIASQYLRNLQIDSAAIIINNYPVLVGFENNARNKNHTEMRVVPNPVFPGEKIRIDLPVWQERCDVRVYTSNGQLVHKESKNNAESRNISLNNPPLAGGMYIILVISESGIFRSKFYVTGR